MSDYSLSLYETIKRGSSYLRDLTSQLLDWRRSIHHLEGYKEGTATWHFERGTRDELLELFLEGMMRELRETVGGLITWQGYIAEMELTLNGLNFVRSMTSLANRVKVIYARLGDNLLTNGGGETALWAAVNTPIVLERVTTIFVTEGVFGHHITGDDQDGAAIGTATIAASAAYEGTISVRLISGAWKFQVYRTDTLAVLASTTVSATGDSGLRFSISNSNTYAGTVGVEIFATAAGSEIYADGCVFQQSPYRTETGYKEDTDSQSEYGLIEEALLRAALSDTAANNEALTELNKRAWPRTLPPDSVTVREAISEQDRLQLLVHGYSHTLPNRYARRFGAANANTHVTNLITDSEFITAGIVETNAMSYKIDERAPLRVWQVLRDILLSGDVSGNRWVGGVYAGRKFDYRQADTIIAYHYRGGKLYNAAGGEIEPWFVLPGLVRLDDAPIGPSQVSGDTADDPRVVFIEEVEFAAPRGITFKVEQVE